MSVSQAWRRTHVIPIAWNRAGRIGSTQSLRENALARHHEDEQANRLARPDAFHDYPRGVRATEPILAVSTKPRPDTGPNDLLGARTANLRPRRSPRADANPQPRHRCTEYCRPRLYFAGSLCASARLTGSGVFSSRVFSETRSVSYASSTRTRARDEKSCNLRGRTIWIRPM